MSIDLSGWRITDQPSGYGIQAWGEDFLEASPAGFSESTIEMNFWDADEKFTFQEQVEKVIAKLIEYGAIPETIALFRLEAAEFEARAQALGKPIRSCWL